MNVYFIRIINNPSYQTRFMPQEVYLDQVGLVLPILKTGGAFSDALPHTVLLYMLKRGGHMTAHRFFDQQYSLRPGQAWCNLPVRQIREDVDYETGRASMDKMVWCLIDEALQPRFPTTRHTYLPAYQDFGPPPRREEPKPIEPFIFQGGIQGVRRMSVDELRSGRLDLPPGRLVRGRDGKLRPG